MISSLMDNNFLGSVKIHGKPLFFLLMNRNILLNNISQWELLFPKRHFNVYENVRRRLGQLKCRSKLTWNVGYIYCVFHQERDSGLIISFHIEIVSEKQTIIGVSIYEISSCTMRERQMGMKLQLWRAVVRRPLAGWRRQTVEVEAAGCPSPFARRKVIREACQGGGSALFVQRGRTGRSGLSSRVWGLVLCDIDNLNWKLTGQTEESNKKKHLESWFDNECFASRKIWTELSNKKVNIPILLMKLQKANQI